MAIGQRQLSTTYRPQTFAEVLGQESVRSILSRAAAENKIAPAYMFSGTRGVGKTTVARILAKAINCRAGPAAEPCNECPFCRQITQGTSLDVLEIDGASHTGVDHVRKLNEEVGYSPIECRYKVVIIDEAHMLSRSAFNALLKTLEEPPRHASFILATTEPHKFPTTIVSRCQHYIFKRLPQSALESHLQAVLQREGVPFDPQAVSVLARKGAGSVRDAMSLLSQILALGEGRIRLETVRDVLGVAGQEMMGRLLQAFADQDCTGLMEQVRQLLDRGLDLGFFLQELTGVWRNLFILKQAGEKGLAVLNQPEEEARDLLGWAERFSLSHIHAAWQMTLEGQRRVLTSVDPALALELLLVNITYLPQLVPLPEADLPPTPGDGEASGPFAAASSPGGGPDASARSASEPAPYGSLPHGAAGSGSDGPKTAGSAEGSRRPPTWEGFMDYLKSEGCSLPIPGLEQAVQGEVQAERLILHCPGYLAKRIREQPGKMESMKQEAEAYFERPLELQIEARNNGQESTADFRERILNEPVVKTAMDTFQAKLVDIESRQGK